jgi:hypothetical protein
LRALGLTGLRVTPDPVRVAREGALWGAICAQNRLAGAVILSDDAGQFRVSDHALCWVHAERLVYKLVPANDRQRSAVEVTRRTVLSEVDAGAGLAARRGDHSPNAKGNLGRPSAICRLRAARFRAAAFSGATGSSAGS